MKNHSWIAAAAATLAAAGLAAPADAYNIRLTGRTLASPQLTADILTRIGRYSREHGGCTFIFSADMRVLAPGRSPALNAVAAAHRGAHVERWSVNACATRQVFEVAMWPSPAGGADFAVVPLTGRMSLAR